MSDFWKWYLALCLALTAMVVALQLRIDTPPVENGYPVVSAATPTPDYGWIDGCGVMHVGNIPSPWPTAIPVDQITTVCK